MIRHLFLLMILVTIISFGPATLALEPAAAQDSHPRIDAQVSAALQSGQPVPVIITLRDPVAADASADVRRSEVAAAQQSTLTALSGSGFRTARTYSRIPAIAGLASARSIELLRNDPTVEYVQVDERIQGHTGQSVPALGADIVHNSYGITGAGVTVAVLDTGINTSHVDLADSIVAQHCFTQGDTFGDLVGDCQPGDIIESDNAQDLNGHGSNVSGIITANGTAVPVGFAPDAGIVAVRVLDRSNSGWVSDWLAGLNWIIDNQGTLGVDVINMSLGTFALFNGSCDANYPTVVSAINQLRALNIAIFASSANNGSSTSLSSPACNSGVIAVGATYDSNVGRQPPGNFVFNLGGGRTCFNASTSLLTITCFTNSNSLLDILAPGAPITSAGSVGTSSSTTYYGTSQASPTAAGVAALLREKNPNLTPDDIETILESTGTLITDTRNGRRFPLINALKAIQFISAPELLQPTAPTITVNRPLFSWSAIFAVSYEMQLDTANPPITTVYNGLPAQYTPASPLPLGTHYWRVRAITSGGPGDWSAIGSLTIESPANIAPASNATTDNTPTLTWNRVTGATSYELEVDSLSTFASPDRYSTPDAGLSFTLPVPLPPDVYFWRVRAVTTAGKGAWAVQSFTILAN